MEYNRILFQKTTDKLQRTYECLTKIVICKYRRSYALSRRRAPTNYFG